MYYQQNFRKTNGKKHLKFFQVVTNGNFVILVKFLSPEIYNAKYIFK